MVISLVRSIPLGIHLQTPFLTNVLRAKTGPLRPYVWRFGELFIEMSGTFSFYELVLIQYNK